MALEKNTPIRQPKNAKFWRGDMAGPETAKVGFLDIGILLAIAVCFDTLSGIICLLPLLGDFLSDISVAPIGAIVFYFLYKRKGIDTGGSKFKFRFFGTLALKFIPILSILPDFTMNVLAVTSIEKLEEETGIKK